MQTDTSNLKIAYLQAIQNLTWDIATNNTGTINSLREQIYDLKQQVNYVPTSSCQDVKTRWPDSPSGLYLIALPSGDTMYVYCHLGNLCGSNEGWMRIAYLDNPSWSTQLYSDDRLWDGNDCRSNDASCCDVEGIPWFYKQLDSPVTDDTELRLCGDQGIADEDNPMRSLLSKFTAEFLRPPNYYNRSTKLMYMSSIMYIFQFHAVHLHIPCEALN